MSRVSSNELGYAALVFAAAMLWAIASYIEHSYFRDILEHTPTSGLVLTAGLRLFLILAFRWRGAFAVAALMIAYKFHDGPEDTSFYATLFIGLLWGVLPYLVMELTSRLCNMTRDFQTLKQKHLFGYAWADSFAVTALSLLQLKIYYPDLGAQAFWGLGAIAGASNFLGIVLAMALLFFVLKILKRSAN